MPRHAPSDLFPAEKAAHTTTPAVAVSGLRYGTFGEIEATGESLERLVEAVPQPLARALSNHVFVFVPLVIGETQQAAETEVARVYTGELADRASCHRTVPIEGDTYVFISTRLMQDRFALAFELFINVAHQYVELLSASRSELPERFLSLVWQQAIADVRGETSHESYEGRRRALETRAEAEAAGGSMRDAQASAERRRYAENALSDALAIYMLSLAIDFEYADLREREYPLLTAPALADRLRLVAELYPAPRGYEFSVRYRRRR